jgi:hypothetical protein
LGDSQSEAAAVGGLFILLRAETVMSASDAVDGSSTGT